MVLRAVDVGTRAMIVAHNHPSGDPRPSRADCAFVTRLANACALFQIVLVDAIIVTERGFSSHRALGFL